MSEPTPHGQRPPYEDVFDDVDADETIDLDKHATVARPMPERRRVPQPGEVTAQALIPEPAPTWTEARIMRLGALAVGSLFLIAFVIVAARACPWYLAWLPFLVGALPYLGFFTMAWRKHLDDESQSRTRRENFEHSKFDAGFTPLADQGANVERYR
jgi:hypothetical protein